MARPTEPGWYWLRGSSWDIVRVWIDEAGEVWYTHSGDESEYRAASWVCDDQWGGKITQEPVVVQHPF